MSGQATVLSAGGATVASSGFYTATGIQQVQTLLNTLGTTEVVYPPPASLQRADLQAAAQSLPTVPAGAGGTYVLEIPDNTSLGSVSIPGGYGSVIFGQGTSGTVTGGDSRTTIASAGSIHYSGNAGEVVASSTVAGTTGSYGDSLTGAVFDLGGGTYSVTAGGNQQMIQVDNSATGSRISATGDGDTIRLGDPTGSGPSAAGPGTNLSLSGRADMVTINSFGNIVGDHGGGSTTISGVSGSSTIFAASNDVYFGAAAVTEFISSASAQTVFGGTGNDTVFNTAGGSIVYNQGTGTGSIFVTAGAASNSTIYGAGAGAVFGGAGHTNLVLGNANDIFVGGDSGSDSIYGGSVTATVFGASNENMQIVGSHAAFEVALGSNSSINAGLSNGGNNFFAMSSTGNTTLAGSQFGTDTFNLDSVAGGVAHTITIQNWHAGDGLFLTGYGAGDVQTMDNAILGGANTFTLSDGTTVTFQGAHPTNASGAAIF